MRIGLVAALLGGCRREAGPDAPRTEPLRSRYAVEFTARNDSCRGYSLGSYGGSAQLDLAAGGEATLELEMTAEALFADAPIARASPAATGPEPEPEPLRCRWRGRGERREGSFAGTLERVGDDAACGATRRLEIACAPWFAAVVGGDAPVAAVRCELRGPYPEALWVLESGGAIVLGASPLRSELERQALGGASLRLVRAAQVQ